VGSSVRRALVSVSDKTGVVGLCRVLSDAGYEVVSTGGTAGTLREAGIPVTDVSAVTEWPEMMGGRIKTLHPRVHGGILARRDDPGDVQAMEAHGIVGIDVVVVNLYPFDASVARPGATHDETIEQIDIGGPAMVRAAAKNAAHVCVVTDPSEYAAVEDAVRSGEIGLELRRRLAARAFAYTARYDAAVASWLAREVGEAEPFPPLVTVALEKASDLRYGDNPHQRAALYRRLDGVPRGVASAELLQGKALSFNNLVDADAAYALVRDLAGPAVAIVKHTNPCGAGVHERDLSVAWARALAGDPTSAFGGIVAVNGVVDAALARAMADVFLEVLIAPGYSAEARGVLARKRNLRVLELPLERASGGRFALREVSGGMLLSDADLRLDSVRDGEVGTDRAPTEAEWAALQLAWAVCKHTKSNAIVIADAAHAIGVGAGQMSRVDAARLAVQRSLAPIRGAAAASDAFFPFRDGLDVLAEAGVTAVVQPGGSVRDDEVLAAADEHGIAMVFTGTRHFRH
jgi:phosphoribosylaminoimidazolecarboxamide formyltransferase/IMP cyclohydrolase